MELFDKRWSVRILAFLHENRGARFVVMKHALDVNADSLTRTLQHLMADGWIQRNPGFGHPLRPEYILTRQGQGIAAGCSRFAASVESLGVAETIYHKWSVPVLVNIGAGVVRFGSLLNTLGVTPRALTQGLERLSEANLVWQPQYYALTNAGREIATRAQALAV